MAARLLGECARYDNKIVKGSFEGKLLPLSGGVAVESWH